MVKQRPRILIVEDEPMIAFGLEELLVDAGFEIAGIAGKVDKALALVDGTVCDGALVDANLAGLSASPVASALAARNIPYIVLSGYSPEQLHGAFHGAHFIMKPYRPAQVTQALKALVAKR